MSDWSWRRIVFGRDIYARHFKDNARSGTFAVDCDRPELGARVEYNLGDTSCGVKVWLRNEHTVTLGVQVPFVASVWLSLDVLNLHVRGSERAIELYVHDSALCWKLLAPLHYWSSDTPRWRDGSWRPLGWRQRQGEPEVVEQREVLVPMPERSYRGKAKLTVSRWGFTKLPRFFDETLTHADIEMDKGEQVPFPGKWDPVDGTYSMHCPARTIEDGIGVLVASVLRDRMRRGGPKWTPTVERKTA